MEIRAYEVGGAEEVLLCPACGGSDLDLADGAEGTGDPSWSLMTRLKVRCNTCGQVSHLSWRERVRFRFYRSASAAGDGRPRGRSG